VWFYNFLAKSKKKYHNRIELQNFVFNGKP